MLLGFTKPRIEGTFTGERMRAWDTDVGTRHGAGRDREQLRDRERERDHGRDLGDQDRRKVLARLPAPRQRRGDQRARADQPPPLADLRHAFELDDYPVEGIVSGEYHLYGKYETPFGFGRLAIDDGVAYGEPFETATASLRFEGSGVRLDAMEIRKSTGTITGAAWVGWDGNYSFNADGTRIPVESLKMASFPRAPLSGLLQFTATGTGTFDVRATTSGCASTICSPATKASASSPDDCRCAARC